ncbi:MAG: response regulator [Xanthomarina sp.]
MKKILIIEDNRDIREVTAASLKLSGYNVSTAENGKIGVEMAYQVMPDLILCDIMMPELDGYGVLKALNESNHTASIPFIFFTAKNEKIDMRKGMNSGADDYLTKPFSLKELLDAIESRLKRHDFLKKEFSRTIHGVSQFVEDASKYLDLEDLSRDFTLLKFKKKESIFMEGSAAISLYFIESGVVKTFKTTGKGKEMVTDLNTAGQFFGQLSLLTDNGTYIESATVIQDAELYEIPKLDFITLMTSNKEVANKFVNLISNDLIDIKEQLMNVAFSTVRQRLAKSLLDIHSKGILTNQKERGISISREDLAALIGTATETAIRMLTEFKEEGFISIESTRKIVVKDKKALEYLALFG